jgi:hypothetical protein
MPPGIGSGAAEALAENQSAVETVFTRIFDQYQIADESSGKRILGHVSKALARLNFEFAERGRKARLNSRISRHLIRQ